MKNFQKLFSTKIKRRTPLNEKLLNGAFNQITTYLKKLKNKDIKVIDFKTPEQIYDLIPLKLSETQKSSDDDILKYTQTIIDYSVHAGSNNYHNSLFGGADESALVGEYLASSLNGSVYTYEIAPIFSLMEEEVAAKFSELMRWKTHDYIFCPGGSYANFYAITSARNMRFPEYKQKGLKALPNMKFYMSEIAHYSNEKGAILCGHGLDNLVKVNTDKDGKIDVEDLEKKIIDDQKNGNLPFAVVSTLGTTVLGSIDPITKIDKICKKYGIWHHVDACLGYGSIFLDTFHEKEPGIKDVDSISIDPHKVMNIPLQCSVFLTKHKGNLLQGNSTAADYLFMSDKVLYDSKLDKGDKSFQCGRHIDIIKLWLFWKYNSTEGIKNSIIETLNTTNYLADLVEEHKNFELVMRPEFTNVCFYFIPDRFIGMKRDEKFYTEIGKLCPVIKADMIKRGNLMTAYQLMNFNGRKLPNFFRPAISFGKDREDMDFIVKEIYDIGKNL